jgi:hypothetical protein
VLAATEVLAVGRRRRARVVGAIARDWLPSVGIDRGNGFAWAGGYVGDGVALANLARANTRPPTDRYRRQPTDRPAVGPTWITTVGAGTTPMARDQHRHPRHGHRRPVGGAYGQAGSTCGLRRPFCRPRTRSATCRECRPTSPERVKQRRPRCGGAPVFGRAPANRSRNVTATPSLNLGSLGGMECSGSTTPPQGHPADAAVAAPVAVGGAAARSDGR